MRLLFDELKAFPPAGCEPVVDHHIHGECLQVHIPGLDNRIEKGDAILKGDIENLCFEKIQNRHSHLLITTASRLSHQTQPVFTFQLLLGDALRDIQKLLRDQAFQLAEGLFLKNPTHFRFPIGIALAQDQFPAFLEERPRWFGYALLQLLLTLKVGKSRKFTRGQLQELADLVVDISSSWRRGSLSPGEKLGDVGLGDLRSCGQISLVETKLAQPLFNYERDTQGAPINRLR